MSKHRITILNHEPTHDQLIQTLNSTHLILNNVNYTREDKFTLGPASFSTIDKLSIKLGTVNSKVFNYNSRGLNIHVVPKKGDPELFYKELEEFMNQFGIDDVNNWVKSRTSFLYHDDNVNTTKFEEFLSTDLGKEVDFDALEIYYDDKLVINFINKGKGNEVITLEDMYVETGLFLIESYTGDDLVLSGLRVIFEEQLESVELESETVAEKEKEQKNIHQTLFHIKPKYRELSTQQELITNGLHPKLISKFPQPPTDEDVKNCEAFYYFTLPKSLFIDKYNLGTNVNLIFNHGTQDLELPEYKLNEWGNEILIQVEDWNKEIELNFHTRYQLPLTMNNYSIEPIAFYGCELIGVNTLDLSPFSMTKFGFAEFFTNDTVFFVDKQHKLEGSIPSPQSEFDGINVITLVTLVLGLLIIGLQLVKPRQKRKD